MESPRLSARIPQPLLQRLQAHVDQQGLIISDGVIAAITCYLGETDQLPIVDRVNLMEPRLSRLEGKS